ncbi:hypothetical protein AA0Z99_13290 [Agrococcus sp. 1P02AA]|uniref:DUF7507 domain-containing protein n=1 Tax=Agrococcus sp. 1P02AA TaxID=3132259 RepID=UPI0039A631E7
MPRGAGALVLALVPAVMLAALTLPDAAAAAPTTRPYALDLQAPGSVGVRDAFAYQVTVASDASSATPLDDIALTAQLDDGLRIDAVPVGGASPVASYAVDDASGTVVFTLEPLVEQLATFSFTVVQTDPAANHPASVLETSLTGTPTTGPAPTDVERTAIDGSNDYRADAWASTVAGSDQRAVTYRFNVREGDTAARSFTTWAQRLSAALPVGAEVLGSSAGWQVTPDADGGAAAQWQRDGTFGHPTPSVDPSDRAIWLTVDYAPASFPAGQSPPLLSAALSTMDAAGTWHAQGSDDAPAPALGDGEVERLSTVLNTGAETLAFEHGRWHEQLSAITSYTGDGLESLTVTDAAMRDADLQRSPLADHLDVYRLRINFSPALARAAVPYVFEYTTDAGTGWQRWVPNDATTATDARISVQPAGSEGWLESGFDQVLELAEGERLTGWRVTVSPDASTTVPGGSEVHVKADVVASLQSFVSGAVPGGALEASVTAAGTTVAGEALSDDDAVRATIADRVTLTTTVDAPGTLGSAASTPIVATVVNTDPAGRSIADAFVRVVLPRGVEYDAATGVSRAAAQTVTGRAVPDIGEGVLVATEMLGDRQVVVLLLDEVASVRAAGEARHRFELLDGYRYTIPVLARPSALDAGAAVEFEAWASTTDPSLAGVPLGFYAPHLRADVHDFDPTRETIAHLSDRSVATAGGGLVLAAHVGDDGAWVRRATVGAGELAQWQLRLHNRLPRAIDDVVLFDRLPARGDGRGSAFPLRLAGPIDVPGGATVEYSRDATSADTGSWSADAEGATAFRVELGSVAAGATVDVELATPMPWDELAGAVATNDATASGTYAGAAASFTSTRASVTPVAEPSLRVESAIDGTTAHAAPGPTLRAGDVVRWSHVVTNTGNALLDAFDVRERFVAGDGRPGVRPASSTETGPLEPGESRRFVSSATIVEGAYEGIATARATAFDPQGQPLAVRPSEATDASWYFGEAAPSAGQQPAPPDPARPPVVVDPAPSPPRIPTGPIPFPGDRTPIGAPVPAEPPVAVPPAVVAPAPAPVAGGSPAEQSPSVESPAAQAPTGQAPTAVAASMRWRFVVTAAAADGRDIVVIDPVTGQPISLGALGVGESVEVAFGGGAVVCERVGEGGSEHVECAPVGDPIEPAPGAVDAPQAAADAAMAQALLLPRVLAGVAALLLLLGLALLARTIIRNRRLESTT